MFGHKTENLLTSIKAHTPIIHHITNYVAANDSANITLAFGGSPIMADELQEMDDIVPIASALIINMGTINEQKIDTITKACKIANKRDIPIILDPVGVGASRLRRETVKQLINEVNISVIKGNMSEIKTIYGLDSESKGVDSIDQPLDGGCGIAKALANALNCIIAITGQVDVVSDGKQTYHINNGHSYLSKLTGTGCMTASLIGVCCSEEISVHAVITGITAMGIAGELAHERLTPYDGIGSYKVYLIDAIFHLSYQDFLERGHINEVIEC